MINFFYDAKLIIGILTEHHCGSLGFKVEEVEKNTRICNQKSSLVHWCKLECGVSGCRRERQSYSRKLEKTRKQPSFYEHLQNKIKHTWTEQVRRYAEVGS